jgi:hypothetical protein
MAPLAKAQSRPAQSKEPMDNIAMSRAPWSAAALPQPFPSPAMRGVYPSAGLRLQGTTLAISSSPMSPNGVRFYPAQCTKPRSGAARLVANWVSALLVQIWAGVRNPIGIQGASHGSAETHPSKVAPGNWCCANGFCDHRLVPESADGRDSVQRYPQGITYHSPGLAKANECETSPTLG